jgi:post-segregation antitoxin (ccd killing protein)
MPATNPTHSDPKSRTKTIALKVSPLEYVALAARARQQGVTISRLIHTALLAVAEQQPHGGELTLEDL